MTRRIPFRPSHRPGSGAASCPASWPLSLSHSTRTHTPRRRLAAVPRPDPRQHHARDGRAVEGRPQAAVEEAGRRRAQFAGRRRRHRVRVLPAEGQERRRAGRVRRQDRRTEVGEELRAGGVQAAVRQRPAITPAVGGGKVYTSAAPASSPAGTRRPATSPGRSTRSRSSRPRTCSSASPPRPSCSATTRWS